MTLDRYLIWRTALHRFGRSPGELTGNDLADVVAQSARERQVILRALAAPEARGVEADQEVVRAAMGALAQRYPDATRFSEERARHGLDDASLAEAIGAELRAGQVLEVIGKVPVEEGAVRAYYQRRRAEFVLPERRTARHILITVHAGSEESRRDQAEARLREVQEGLAAGASFDELALRYSECPSALDGGRLGELRRGQLYPELEAALFAMYPGELRMAESVLGFHLLRCDAIIPPQPLSYEAAAPAIRHRLEQRARDRALKAWLAQAG